MFHVLIEVKVLHPIRFQRLNNSETAAFHKVEQIFDRTPGEGTLATLGLEVLIATSVHSLVRCHSQAHDLVGLANRQDRYPGHVKQRIGHHPADPRITGTDGNDGIPET